MEITLKRVALPSVLLYVIFKTRLAILIKNLELNRSAHSLTSLKNQYKKIFWSRATANNMKIKDRLLTLINNLTYRNTKRF